MADSADAEDPVVQLVEACLDVREHGGDAAVDALLAQHAEHAAAVRLRLSFLARTGLIGGDGREGMPERLGEFRLLDRLGSGGMGVVYLAERDGDARRVALKVIHPEHLYFPGTRERFRREIEAIARLEHPGITPVHVAGEHGGVPYFAMEYVAGGTLEQVLRSLRGRRAERLSGADLAAAVRATADGSVPPVELPQSWVDACVEVAAQIAEAVAHAHERGVLHRDIKPSNVGFTADCRVRVLDFGLAQVEGDARITRSGSLLGSLPYMAPEQVRGEADRIGPRTDIYGVGVTLYEMLTLHPAFWSESVERIRERVLDARPVAIDRLNSAVPPQVETVCLTAMDPDPRRRYARMVDLVADLRRTLRHEPIRARRPGRLLRLRRLAERRPATATAVSLGLVITVVGPLGFAWQSDVARREISASYVAQAQQRERAELGLDDAIAAVDEMLAHATDAELARSPGGDDVRRRMLDSARAMYERLLQRESDHADLATRVVRTRLRLAELHEELGNPDTAMTTALDAAASARRLQSDSRDVEDLRTRTELLVIGMLGSRSRVDEAVARAIALRGELRARLDAGTGSAGTRQLLAEVSYRLATVLLVKRDIDGCIASAREAVAGYEAVAEEHPADLGIQLALARTLEYLAYTAGFHARDPDYAQRFARAIEIREQAGAATAGDPEARLQLGEALSSWAHVEIVGGDNANAIGLARRARDVLADLAARFPSRARYAVAALRCILRLVSVQLRAGETDLAVAQIREGLAFGVAARTRLPAVSDIAYHVAMLHSMLAGQLGGTDRTAATEHFAQGHELWQQLLAMPTPALQHLIQVGTFYDGWAEFERVGGHLDRAVELAIVARDHHRAAHKATGLERATVRLCQSLIQIARLELARDRPLGAVAALAAAVDEAGATRDQLRSEDFAALAGRDDYEQLLRRAP